MSTYVLMRILESAPHRYDLGIKLLTWGSLGPVYDRLASRVEEEQRVLDIGCGTGALSLRAARRGARVTGIDIHPEMLEIAAENVRKESASERVDLREKGVAELDGLDAESFDVIMSGLCFSELSDDEIRFALRESGRILAPGGLLLIADEVRPDHLLSRMVGGLIRIPMSALTYLLTGQTTHALVDFPERVRSAGFSIESTRTTALGSLLELVARKPSSLES